MKKKHAQKWMTVVMAAAIMAGTAACGSSSGTQQASAEAGSAGTISSSSKERDTTAEGILARDYSDPIEISYAAPQVDSSLDYNDGNDYYRWWTDTFNVTWDITGLTWENWIPNVTTWAGADDLPDWTVFNFNSADAVNYAQQELVLRWPDDWREKYPNLAKAADYSPANTYYEEALGGMYYFFRPTYAENFPADTITEHTSIYLRRDWAEQAGYDLSENLKSHTMTLSEFLDYLRAVKNAGITDYPWYNTSIYVGMAIDRTSEGSGCFQSAYQMDESGQYVWEPGQESSGIKASAKLIRQAYDEGLLYPEFYTIQSGDDVGHFDAAGDSAAMLYSTNVESLAQIKKDMEENLGVDFDSDVALFVLTDDSGVEHESPSLNYFGANMLSPHLSDEEVDRILSMWDYSATEEGQMRIRMGEKGTDWDYDENGNIVNLLADTEYGDASTKYTNLYPLTGSMTILGDDFSFVNPSQPEDVRTTTSDLFIARAAATNAKDKQLDYDIMSYTSPNAAQASFNYYDAYAGIISGGEDFDTAYDSWVADKSPMTQPVADDMNSYKAGLASE